ncbi:MAG: serine/threonine protein kinase, partial [Planctomycetes bacterium]|nr:serine/threonine protein kinase [Planctomycetota bacterium]
MDKTPPDPPDDRSATPADTQPMQTEKHPRLGSFSIEEKIGEGGMGVVYRAYDPDLQRTVAIKRIHPSLAGNAELAERFVSEARAVAAVDHPNIAQIHAIHARDAESPAFFVMEFVEGESAEQRVRRLGPLAVKEALDLVIQAARGLQAAHRRGIVHGDVKPSNLVIAARGRVKLVDFGLSRPVGDEASTLGSRALGTPHYASPEQHRHEALDQRSDIYSLGCTLFELLCGRPPFQGENAEAILRAHAEGRAPSVKQFRTEVPPEVDRIVDRMLAKDRDHRYPNYDDLLADLERCVVTRRPDVEIVAKANWTRALLSILAWSSVLTIAVILLITRSDTLRDWFSPAPDRADAGRALLQGVAATDSAHRDRLDFTFTSSSLHPAIRFGSDASASGDSSTPPHFVGATNQPGGALAWSRYSG